jgi:hypothetical protein
MAMLMVLMRAPLSLTLMRYRRSMELTKEAEKTEEGQE